MITYECSRCIPDRIFTSREEALNHNKLTGHPFEVKIGEGKE